MVIPSWVKGFRDAPLASVTLMSILVKLIRIPMESAEKPPMHEKSLGTRENSTLSSPGFFIITNASSEIVAMRPTPRVPSGISIGTTWPRGPIPSDSFAGKT